MATVTVKTKTKPKAAPAKAARTKADTGSVLVGKMRAIADRLKLAADGSRLALLVTLESQETNVGDLASAIGGATQPATSHHLALLRHGGLVSQRREGKHIFYGLTAAGRSLLTAARSLEE